MQLARGVEENDYTVAYALVLGGIIVRCTVQCNGRSLYSR